MHIRRLTRLLFRPTARLISPDTWLEEGPSAVSHLQRSAGQSGRGPGRGAGAARAPVSEAAEPDRACASAGSRSYRPARCSWSICWRRGGSAHRVFAAPLETCAREQRQRQRALGSAARMGSGAHTAHGGSCGAQGRSRWWSSTARRDREAARPPPAFAAPLARRRLSRPRAHSIGAGAGVSSAGWLGAGRALAGARPRPLSAGIYG